MRLIRAALICSMLASAPAHAAEGCKFLWPLETEMAWMAAGAAQVATGASIKELPKDKAIELALKPAADVTLPAKPTGTPKADDKDAYAGFVVIEATEPAHIQVTLSSHAWIDAVQGGAPLEATGHTGSRDCPQIRKSVRFEAKSGPLTLQISSSKQNNIRIAVRPAAD